LFKFVKKIFLFCLLLVLFLEFFFRFVVPASQRPAYFQDPESKLVFFDSTFQTKGKYTWGRFPLDGGEWVLNNDGWLSIYDYQPATSKNKPRVALIGDSFIASLSTDAETHIDVRLTEDFSKAVDFYSFGMGGQYLEQYRVLLDHLDKEYDPDIYVFFVNDYDIKSSLTTYGDFPLYFQLEPVPGGFEQVVPRPFEESRLKRLARRSSLLLYLRINAGITAFGGGRGMVDVNANPNLADGLVENPTDPIMVQATNYIFEKMVGNRPGKQFIFVGDGRRHLLYQGETNPPLFEDCVLIREACNKYPQCHYLDLMAAFKEDYSENGRSFNYEDNSHWNEYGSDFVAGTVGKYLKNNNILP
jgi:hypothetical protein